MNEGQLAVRVNPANSNHHLWNNNGTWFVHYTRHEPGFTKIRCRHSLRTKSVAEARRRRDVILNPEQMKGEI